MRVGNTKYEPGTRVILRGITDPHDLDLNGRAGKLCHPFRGFPIRDAGVRLDATECTPETCKEIAPTVFKHYCEELSVTVYKNEFAVL
jgi:hypothetical protein